jgi:phage antirepressor YoqD-like protein
LSRRRRKAKKKTTRYIAVGAIAIIALLLIYSMLNWSKKSESNEKQQPKALIVDQLSETNPNETFIETAKQILRDAGFKVYRYRSVGVNVNFFRDLPRMNNDLIIFRVHSAINENSGDIVFFTSETFDESKAASTYLSDFLADPPMLVKAMIYEGGEAYFGITPSFVKNMNGQFNDTLIIMMGCTGLEPNRTSMANAFISKGARIYVGYDGLVSPYYTDQAITILLQKLLIENKTVQNAVTQVNDEVEPDPDYKSKLSWFPVGEGDYMILSKMQVSVVVHAQGKTREFDGIL